MLILLRFVWCHIIWYILENVPGVIEKNVYYAAVGWNVLYTSSSFGPKNSSIPMFSCWFYVWKTYSLLPRKYWNPLLLLYGSVRSVSICFKNLGALMLGEYMLMVIISSWCNNLSVIMQWPFCLLLSFLVELHFVWYIYDYPCFLLVSTCLSITSTLSLWAYVCL